MNLAKINLVVLVIVSVLLGACDNPVTEHAVEEETIDPNSLGAKLMKDYCSQCHAPPRVSSHTAEEWPNVVYRMQERRRMKAYKMMDDEELETLLSFLKQHAKS